MRKYFIIFTVVIVGCVIAFYYHIQLKRIDTIYATNFARVLGSYDIKSVDNYVDENTIVVCRSKKDTYSNLRENIVRAFMDKKFKLSGDASYGNGNDRFINNVQKVNVEVHVQEDFHGKSKGDVLVILEIEKKGINRYRIKSIKFEDGFFEQLFFGVGS